MNSQAKSPIGLWLKKIWKKNLKIQKKFEWIFYLVEIFKNLEEILKIWKKKFENIVKNSEYFWKKYKNIGKKSENIWKKKPFI